MNRYDLNHFEWSVIKPLLPNKPRSVLPVDDRRVLNGIRWVLRSGIPRRDLPQRDAPYTTCYDRFNPWRKKGIHERGLYGLSDFSRKMPVLRIERGEKNIQMFIGVLARSSLT